MWDTQLWPIMVSVLDSGSDGLGSSPDWGHLCCTVLGQDTSLSQVPLSSQENKWGVANCQDLTKMLGETCDGLASHPGGVANEHS